MVSDREPPYGPDDVGGYFNVPVQTVSSWNRQNLMRRYQVGRHVGSALQTAWKSATSASPM